LLQLIYEERGFGFVQLKLLRKFHDLINTEKKI
jgi:hypothetical protein